MRGSKTGFVLVVGITIAAGLWSNGTLLRNDPKATPAGPQPITERLDRERLLELINGPATSSVTLTSSQGSQLAGVILGVVIVNNGNPATNTGSTLTCNDSIPFCRDSSGLLNQLAGSCDAAGLDCPSLTSMTSCVAGTPGCDPDALIQGFDETCNELAAGGFVMSTCTQFASSVPELQEYTCPPQTTCGEYPFDAFLFDTTAEVFDLTGSDGTYEFKAPDPIKNACDADPSPCTEGLQLELGQCGDDTGCDYETYRRTLQGGCDQLGPDILPDGGCDLLDQPDDAGDSIIDDLFSSNPFIVGHRRHARWEAVEFAPGADGKLVVLRNMQVNYRSALTDYGILQEVFNRYPNRDSLTIVENGQEYTVVRAPDGATQRRSRIGFYIHHPDGFVFTAGDSHAWGGVGPNDITDDPDFMDAGTFSVRPLPNGDYRVIWTQGDTLLSDSPDMLASLFGEIPQGTNTITLIQNGREYTVTRPAGVTGSDPGTAGLDSAAALIGGDAATAVPFRERDGKIVVTGDAGTLQVGRNAFLRQVFSANSGVAFLTVVEGGREYRVTKVGEGTVVNGQPVEFIVTHPDGFTFNTGPRHDWNGLGTRDIYTVAGADSNFLVRPTPDGKYQVINNRTGSPLSGNAEALDVVFSRVDTSTNSIVLVENGRATTVARPGTLAGSFEISHSIHARHEYVRFAPAEDGRLIVLEDGQVNYSLAAHSTVILRPLFERFPGRDTLVIVQDGREYTVVKAPAGTREESRLRVEFIIHHPDGFTYTAGEGYTSGLVGPNDIFESDNDLDDFSRYAVRPLPDGTYRVLFNRLGQSLSGDQDALRRIFRSVPTGTDSITLIENGDPVTVTRPPGTPGSDPGTAALDSPGAALVGDGVIGFRRDGTSASARIDQPGTVTVVNNNLQTGRPAVSDAGFLDSVFERFPDANRLTVIEAGRPYLVTRTRGGLHVAGTRIPYIISHPDGFNFTAGPDHSWNGLTPGGAPTNSPVATPGSTAPPPARGGNSTSLVIPPAGDVPRAIVTQPDGTFVLEVGDPAIAASLTTYPVTMETDALGNRIFTLPGETFVDPAPGVEVVNVAENTDDFALTPAQLQTLLASANDDKPAPTSLALVALGQNVSTGEGAFVSSFINNGKPRVVQGDMAVLQPTDNPELPDGLLAMARRVLRPGGPRSLLGMAAPLPLFSAVERPGTSQEDVWRDLLALARLQHPAQVTTLTVAGYCLQKDLAVPGQGQIYTLADAATQRQFDPSRDIVVATSRVAARGELNPDSDPDAYFHSIRQWAVWTQEKGYDEAAFTDAFVELTRENVTADGQTWSEQIEELVRELAPNRYHDVQSVLAEAGQPVGGARTP